ncbi:MAG: hypothetical protein QM769_04965 [Pseudoxanthomonas sp.]
MAVLSQTNPYLSTAAKRKLAARVTIATSSAIEGITAPFKPRTAQKSSRITPVPSAKSV